MTLETTASYRVISVVSKWFFSAMKGILQINMLNGGLLLEQPQFMGFVSALRMCQGAKRKEKGKWADRRGSHLFPKQVGDLFVPAC